ncbi:MAG: DUF4394 domain-containing protein [Phycisphaerales bacterium]
MEQEIGSIFAASVIALAAVDASIARVDASPTEPPTNAPAAWTARELSLDSGWLTTRERTGDVAEVVFSRELEFTDAAWTRLFLEGTVLSGQPGSGREAWVFISTPTGDVQPLNAEHLRQWTSGTAYFNGNRVRVDVVMYPGAEASRLVIPSAMLGEEMIPERSICGLTDDRTPSADPRVARLMPASCTAWLFNDANRMLLSAGHCGTAASTVVQFNVPLSGPTGTPIFPPPQHQYAVDGLSIQWQQTGLGNDWAYFGVFPNPITGLTPAQAQGQVFNVTPAPAPTTGAQIRITGFGATYTPISPTWNYAQKTHVGAYTARNGNGLNYTPDTTGGNSGSPIILESTGQVIGVHTSGGCGSSGGANAGTAFQAPALQNALAAPRGVCGSGATGIPDGPLYAIGDIANNVGTVRRNSGQFSRIAAPTSVPSGLAYRPVNDRLYAIDSAQRLVMIDPATGVGTPGPAITGAPAPVTDLVHDPRPDRFIGVCNATGQFVHIDPVTGVATKRGTAHGGHIVGIALVTMTGQLLAIDARTPAEGGPALVAVNRVTGARTVIGPLGAGLTNVSSLAWSDDEKYLTTIDVAGSRLFRVDRLTGAATLVGPTSAIWTQSAGGLAYRRVEPVCSGDLNFDGRTDTSDLSILLNRFSSSNLPGAEGDLNGDGTVSTPDLVMFVAVYGCTNSEQ